MALLAQRSLGHLAFRGLAPEGPPEVDSVLKPPPSSTANFHTKILDFRGFDSSRILVFKGWNSQAHREFPGKSESSNLSGDSLSGEIGRSFKPPQQYSRFLPSQDELRYFMDASKEEKKAPWPVVHRGGEV